MGEEDGSTDIVGYAEGVSVGSVEILGTRLGYGVVKDGSADVDGADEMDGTRLGCSDGLPDGIIDG